MWNTDRNGNFVSSSGVVSGTSAALQSIETSFQQDLNGDGVDRSQDYCDREHWIDQPGAAWEQLFSLSDGGSAVELSYQGAPVEAGQFDQFGGHWVPIGAEQTANGYEVAWKMTGADQFQVWNTDSKWQFRLKLWRRVGNERRVGIV